MKKLFVYTLAMFTLASCISEGLVVDVQEQPEDDGRMSIEVEPLTVLGEGGSRSSIYYDKYSGSAMEFVWGEHESLGVFAYANQEHPQQMKYNIVDSSNSSSLLRYIEPDKNGYNALTENTLYVAYFPYKQENEDYTKIPIDYRGQVQTGHVDMSVYFKTTDPAAYAPYLESEKEASKHLGKYDYLCTAPQMTTYKKGINFQLSRVGSIARFYIMYPAACVYDSLQMVNPKLDFVVSATMDASSTADKALTPVQTSHVMSLELRNPEYDPETNPDVERGFDVSMNGAVPAVSTFYNPNNNQPYLIAYLMMAPINFAKDGAPQTNLFLFGHDKGNPDAVRLFKATLTSQPDLKNNVMFKWTLRPEDAPIEFVETTIEDWKEATGFDNGDAGNGTGGW